MGKRGLEGFKIALDAMLQALVFIGFLYVVFCSGVWYAGLVCWFGLLVNGFDVGLTGFGIPSSVHHQ